jgi:ribosomal protein S18 acetylase RimI-like enzyme
MALIVTATVRLLTPADIPSAMRLKEAAGWNQTETDWLTLMRLAPETCFGLASEGALVATTTAVLYERKLAWIGMVLTDPDHRRRGLGRRLMEHALATLAVRQVEWIKLDATDMGARLYRELGFDDEGPIERWCGPAGGQTGSAVVQAANWLSLDRPAFGADRSALLAELAPLGAASIAGEAYAMGRPGSKAAYFGPCLSRSPEAARELLVWFLARCPREQVYWDLLPTNTEAVRLARAFGFEPLRRLVRMVRRGHPGAAPLKRDDARVFAIAGFEYG